MQFVWVYWDAGAAGDELRWSIRSVRANFQGDVRITLVGDRPAWYQGEVIEKPKIPEIKLHNWQDVISKMRLISTHKQIEESFVWMCDDIYLLNPCTFDDLNVSRCAAFGPEEIKPLRHKKWNRLRKETMDLLRSRGYSSYDYATHLPQTVVKSNLRDVFKEFEVDRPLLWEILYGNLFRSDPIDCLPFLHRQAAPVTSENANAAVRGSVVLNHGNKKGWCPEFREWLENKFPEASPEEKKNET